MASATAIVLSQRSSDGLFGQIGGCSKYALWGPPRVTRSCNGDLLLLELPDNLSRHNLDSRSVPRVTNKPHLYVHVSTRGLFGVEVG